MFLARVIYMREFAEECQQRRGLSEPLRQQKRYERGDFPVLSLIIREFKRGEWFASDCILRQQKQRCRPFKGRHRRLPGPILWSYGSTAEAAPLLGEKPLAGAGPTNHTRLDWLYSSE